jgi:hypothetical protein
MRFAQQLVLLSLGGLGLLGSAELRADTLRTPSYDITITENCTEDVNCQDVTYYGVNRRSGKTIHLKGHRLVHFCPGDLGDGPGKTPCHPIGYEFRNGNTVYTVGDDGTLVVKRGSTVLINEHGTWSDY